VEIHDRSRRLLLPQISQADLGLPLIKVGKPCGQFMPHDVLAGWVKLSPIHMNSSRLALLLLCAVVSVAILPGSGCSKKSTGSVAIHSKAFDSAQPDVKQLWDQAVAADAAHNYSDTVTALKALRTKPLNDEQMVALDKETTDFKTRLFDAAGKNDPAAVQAVQLMRSQR
jgi:hypothetical protein